MPLSVSTCHTRTRGHEAMITGHPGRLATGQSPITIKSKQIPMPGIFRNLALTSVTIADVREVFEIVIEKQLMMLYAMKIYCIVNSSMSEKWPYFGPSLWLAWDLNCTPNWYGKTWRFLCPFFRNLHLRENLARDTFTSTVSTVTNSVQNIFTHLRYCDK